MKTIKQGDRVFILPEWRDKGDENFQWFATDNESAGRVSITPRPWQGIAPIQTVETSMITLELIN